jgi:hypothetical protein
MVSTAEYYRQNEPARKRRITQQKKYQKTAKGRGIKLRANKLRAKLGLKVGDPRDAAHYAGSKTKGRPQAKSTNRASRSLKIRNT